MKTIIEGIGDGLVEPKQLIEHILPNGETYYITMEYLDVASPSGWYMSLKYKDKTYFTYRRVVLSVDMLDDLQNLLPYGIFVRSQYKLEPLHAESFSSKQVEMYTIDKEWKNFILNNI